MVFFQQFFIFQHSLQLIVMFAENIVDSEHDIKSRTRWPLIKKESVVSRLLSTCCEYTTSTTTWRIGIPLFNSFSCYRLSTCWFCWYSVQSVWTCIDQISNLINGFPFLEDLCCAYNKYQSNLPKSAKKYQHSRFLFH